MGRDGARTHNSISHGNFDNLEDGLIRRDARCRPSRRLRSHFYGVARRLHILCILRQYLSCNINSEEYNIQDIN